MRSDFSLNTVSTCTSDMSRLKAGKSPLMYDAAAMRNHCRVDSSKAGESVFC